MSQTKTPTPGSEQGPGAASMTELAYAALEERIVTLRLKPGEFLSEQTLAEQLDLGRTPIREALQKLAREGLVVILPRRGILVSDTNVEQQLLVLEVRRELERLLSRKGAERASASQRARFQEIADGMDAAARSNDEIVFLRLDRELNRLLTEAAHNEFAAGAMRLINGHSRRFWYQHYKKAADLPLCARLHGEQARAIAAADAEGAALAADRLIDYTIDFARAVSQSARADA